MSLSNVRQIAEYVAGSVQISPEMAREAGDRIPQLLTELAEHSVLIETLLSRASEADDLLVKEVLEGSAIELTSYASGLLAKMEVAGVVARRQQESDNAARQEAWSGIPISDELFLELVAKLSPEIQNGLVNSWFKNANS